MGEVYRADDLELGQSVALKFLPDQLARDARALDRFRGEVRLARQVSHPNVCRVYDIGQVDGHYFLSMEYVDGEDLGLLLKRIGRFPADRATELARQLCLGLAAAHETGVLHRDLKPANIMVDGRGKLLVTDFGLAEISERVSADDVRSGTPAYMAPEQLAGREVSERSDIYSLGLVLHEVFTGKPVWEASSLAELFEKREHTPTPTPSSHIVDLDPTVERVIQRCLEADPAKRPSSAVAVAAALPGGDPLQAALAAGETPSPALVADSGEAGSLRPAVAAALLFTGLAGLLLGVIYSDDLRAFGRLQLPIAPRALEHVARELVSELRADVDAPHSAYGFRYDVVDRERLEKLDPELDSESRALLRKRLNGGAVSFWYRQSPERLLVSHRTSSVTRPTIARVSLADPPPLVPGMVSVRLGPTGRLREFSVVPPYRRSPGAIDRTATLDWSAVFEAAEIDPESLSEVEPMLTPPVQSDTHRAWERESSSLPGQMDRVEAGSSGGKLVWFRVVAPWERLRPVELDALQRTEQRPFHTLYTLLLLVGGAFLARRNSRLGRGDQRGALRLALFVFVVNVVAWLLASSQVADFSSETALVFGAVADALLVAGWTWLLYLALEPFVRRRWPERIVSWSRLLDGRWRDPLVGRDVLIGLCMGLVALPVLGGIDVLGQLSFELRDRPSTPWVPLSTLLGFGEVGGTLCALLALAVIQTFLVFVLLVLLHAILRRLWLVLLVTATVGATLLYQTYPIGTVWFFCYMALWSGVTTAVAVRFGLLASVAFTFAALTNSMAITSHVSAWYAGTSHFVVGVLAALAFCGFQVSRAGSSLIRQEA